MVITKPVSRIYSLKMVDLLPIMQTMKHCYLKCIYKIKHKLPEKSFKDQNNAVMQMTTIIFVLNLILKFFT